MTRAVLSSAARHGGVILVTVLLLGACDRANHLSKDKSGAVVQASLHFKSPKYASIPRVLSVNTGGSVVFDTRANATSGEMFGLEQLAKVDPVVAVLRARGRVDVEEFVSAVPLETRPPEAPPLAPAPLPATTGTGTGPATQNAPAPQPTPPPAPVIPMGSRGWIHTFRITPTAKLDTAALSSDDGDDEENEPIVRSFGPAVSRTPGWKLAIGTREFIKVLDVFDSKSKNAEVAAGELAVDFLWRWRPSSVGDVFDTESSEFQSLPEAVRQAAQKGGVGLETSRPLWSRAILRRTGTGWAVKTMDWAYGLNKQRDF